jgi:hypothetical protein
MEINFNNNDNILSNKLKKSSNFIFNSTLNTDSENINVSQDMSERCLVLNSKNFIRYFAVQIQNHSE